MLLYCLKCRKNTESKNLRLTKQIKQDQCPYQNVQCMKVKNRYLLKSVKLVEN